MRREQRDRYVQYLLRYVHHITVTKMINLLRVELRLMGNNPDVTGLYPHFLQVEISNRCNLSCPLCQMGMRKIIPRENLMNYENYKKCIEPVTPYLFQVFLFDWGEPFLNRDIYDIIAFNTANNIGSVVSTNGNVPIDAKRILESGLEYLILSGDGVTQDVYSRYRVGGDIARVFHNLSALVTEKRKRKSRYPIIEWQCLVTKYNENHLETIKKTVLKKGVDRVRFANINFFSTDESKAVQEQWLPANPAFRSFAGETDREKRNRGIRRPCFWLWRGGIINVNGGMTPCCLYDIPDWGNVFEEGFAAVWNNTRYREARERSRNNPHLKKQDIVCDHCTAPFIYK